MPPPSNFGWARKSFGKSPKKKLLKSRRCIVRVALRGSHDDATLAHLRVCEQERLPSKSYSLDHLMWRSSNFVTKFPCQNVKLENLLRKGVPHEELEQHMQSVYPIIHHSCLDLLLGFLQHKQQHGSHIES
ncbi:Protein of unknown function DUF4804 [Trinorchestia longiramus]|nr:Protein of unknown function DUF4804 [Trinorchestia longiramus]